jgi:hypothetical protein
MLIAKVISGGQTGADQAALLAARAAGIPTGGWAPWDWMTEDGPAPWLADYGLQMHPDRDTYPERTERNVRDADACLWFGNPHSPGGRLTLSLCAEHDVDCWVVISESTPQDVADWLRGTVFPGNDEGVVLMVAGNRESRAQGIGEQAMRFLTDLFGLLKEGC